MNLKRPLGNVFWSTVVYFVGLGVVAGLGVERDGTWTIPLFASGGLGSYFFWKNTKFADFWSKYFSFGAVFLLACCANRVLYIVDFVQSGQRFDETPFFSTSPWVSLFLGEVATIAGTLLTCAAWVWAGGVNYSPGMMFNAERGELVRVLSSTYAGSIIALTLTALAPGFAAVLGQLLPVLSGLGIAVSFVLPRIWARRTSGQLHIATLMSVPFIAFSLGSGMKEYIILSLMPVGFFLWQAVRSFWYRTALVVVASGVLALLTAYVGYYRTEVWLKKSNEATTEVMGDFQEALARDPGETLGDGLEKFLARSNASVHRGWAVGYVDLRGYQPELVFEPLTYVFVPRIFWPEKPELDQGSEYQHMIFAGESSSSLAAGFYTSLYLGGGWVPVGLGAVFVGLLMAGLSRLANTMGGPILVGLFGFAMIPFALRLDDSWSVGALSAPIVAFCYVALIYFVSRGALGMLKIPT